MFELAALCAVLAAAAAAPGVVFSPAVVPSPTASVSRQHVQPYPYISYVQIPKTYSTNLDPYTAVQFVHLAKKRTAFLPGYVSATPYAATFYAPATPGSYSITSRIPRGPFVSAYTAPAHYIKKRFAPMAPF